MFCNTKSDTDFLEALLSKKGVKLEKINSDLNQAKRNKVIGGLKAGEFNLLIATDVAARGLDIDHIDLVINYSLHDHPETYVHRTGRTGRAGREGMAITLVAPRDFIAFHHLKKELSVEFEEYVLPK